MDVVFHHAALGDFVLVFPLLRSLRRTDDKAGCQVVSAWQKASLAAAVFDHVTPMDIEMIEFTRLFAEGGPTAMSPAVRETLEEATRVVSFVSAGGDAWAKNIQTWCPHAAIFFVRPRPPEDFDDHVTAWHREQLRRQGLELPESDASSPLIDMPGSRRRGNTQPTLCIHPGSGGEHKCWPWERFVALSQTLGDAGWRIRWLLGEVERDRWPADRIATLENTDSVSICRSTLELLDALKTADAYLGNDAGPTHLAAQLGMPTIALFGPSSVTHWRPLGKHVTVLAPETPRDMDWLPTDAVLEAVQAIKPPN